MSSLQARSILFELEGTNERARVDVDSPSASPRSWEQGKESMQDQVKNIAGLRVLPLDSAEEPGKGGKKPDPILLLKQLRQRGYCLEVDLPTCVHPSLTQPLTSLSDKTTIFVSSSEEWDHLLSTWPGTLEGILSAILESLFQIYRRSKVFVERQEALHGIWEVAYIAYSNSLSSVFSAECLQDILDLLSRTFRRGSSEPGLSSAGSMMAGALWNMISNSRAMMKSPSEMKWDSPPSSPGLRDERLVTNHLLRNGLIKSCCDLVKEASSLDEIKLSHEFRSGHRSLAVAWTLGVLRSALSTKMVHGILSKASDEEMNESHSQSKKVMRIQEDTQQPSHDDDTKVAPAEEELFLGITASSLWSILLKAVSSFGADVRFDTSNADTSITTHVDQSLLLQKTKSLARSTTRQLSTPTTPVNRSMRRGVFGEVGSMLIRSSSPSVMPSRSSSIAKRVEAKKGAAGRGCKVNREGVPLLLPMTYIESVVAIQSHYRVHVASTKYKKLMQNIRDKVRGKDAHGEERKAVALTDDDREAARIAMERLVSSKATDLPSSLRSSLDQYFDYSPLLCPGIAAVETLFDVLSSAPSALNNFLAFSDIGSLLKLINFRLPLRSQHIALVLVSSLLRGGVALVPPSPPDATSSEDATLLLPCFVPGQASSPRSLLEVGNRADRMDPSSSNDLITRLSPLIELEYMENTQRYGPGAPPIRPEPGPRKGYLRALKLMQQHLKDARWKDQGSEVAVQAAVCAWGLASRVLVKGAKHEAAVRLQMEQRMMASSGSRLGLMDSIGLMMKGGQGGELVPLELSVRGIMKMTVTGLATATRGPAIHILSAALVAMALEPTCLALLVRSGLVDAGDVQNESLTKPRRNQKQALSSRHQFLLGVSESPRGIVGDMLATRMAEHAECAAALLALTVIGERKVNDEATLASKGGVWASQQWPGRVINAGGWSSLIGCLDILPKSKEIQTVVAIAARFMAEEIVVRAKFQRKENARSSQEGEKVHETPFAADSGAVPREKPDPREKSSSNFHHQDDSRWLGIDDSEHKHVAPSTVAEATKRLMAMFVHPSLSPLTTLPQSLSLLSRLINNGDVIATGSVSPPQAVLFSSIACHHIGSVDSFRDPLGEAGLVAALMSAARRWVDGTIGEQRELRRMTEWVMSALLQLLQGKEGRKNIDRLAEAFKPPTAEQEAMREMRSFGHSSDIKPGAKPLPPVQTPQELIAGMTWHGLGWGKHGNSSLDRDQASQVQATQSFKPDKIEDGRRTSAFDPISVLCQIVDVICPRHRSIFMNIKLPALKALKLLSQVKDYRQRMVEAGAGERLISVSTDLLFDSKTRSAAAALWMFISETDEGKDPRWWACLRSRKGDLPTKVDPQTEIIWCKANLQVELLLSDEVDSETVGAKGSIALTYRGEDAKAAFIECGGLEALVQVLRKKPMRPPQVLAPVCSALLNLSSHVPAQPKMTSIVDLLIRLNRSFSADFTGPSQAAKGTDEKDDSSVVSLTSGRSGATASASSHLPENDIDDDKDRPQLVEEILYGTSGALNNLSKHPDNVSCLYAIELSKKTEEAKWLQGIASEKAALPLLSQRLREPTQSVWAPGLIVDVHRGPASLSATSDGKTLLSKGTRKSDRWSPLVTQVEERIVKSGREIEEDVSLTFKRGGQEVTSTVNHFKPKPRGGMASLAKKMETRIDSSSAHTGPDEVSKGLQVGPMKDANMLSQLSSLLTDLDGRMGKSHRVEMIEHFPSIQSSSDFRRGQALSVVHQPSNKRTSVLKERHLETLERQAQTSRRSALTEFSTPKTTIWPKVEGSIFSEGLFEPYRLPESDSSVFVYQDRKKRVDELPGNGLGDEDDEKDDGGSRKPGDGSADDDMAMNILRSLGDLPFDPIPPKTFSVSGCPPGPGIATLPPMEEMTSIQGRVSPRPLAAGEVEVVEPDPGPPWSLDSSIFAPRPKQSDSKSYYDESTVFDKATEVDWKACCSKERFSKLCSKYLQPSEVKDLLAALKARYADALKVFDYYSAYSAGSSFALHSNGWIMMIQDCDLSDEKSATCKSSDLERLFIAVNFEEDKKSEASKLNLDNALVRTEFLEAIIRVAIAKFSPEKAQSIAPDKKKQVATMDKKLKVIVPDSPSLLEAGKLVSSASVKAGPASGLIEAVTRLLDQNLIPLAQPEAHVDANFFRMHRLYTCEVDLLLTSKKKLLHSIFEHYRSLSIDPSAGGMADARLDMEEWLILMNEGGLYHRYFTQREAKLAFLWSRMKCIDECSNAKSMSRAQSLSFLDFLEALGRVSDMISPPPPEDLASMGFSDVSSYYQQATSTGFYCPDRASGSFIAKTFTRPLEVKITQMLEVLVNNLMSPGLFSAPDEEHLMIKLKRRRAKDGSIAVAG